ncbi:MAG: hypothetical protein ABSH49_14835 [Bryobacteraceae bacterium]|jgi:hypothetical protein
MAGELLAGLVDRGLAFNEPRLYIPDGGKAPSAGSGNGLVN